MSQDSSDKIGLAFCVPRLQFGDVSSDSCYGDPYKLQLASSAGEAKQIQIDVDKPLGLTLETSKAKGGGLRVKVRPLS